MLFVFLVLLLTFSLGYQTVVQKNHQHCGQNSICLGVPGGMDISRDGNFGNNYNDKCVGVKILVRTISCIGG